MDYQLLCAELRALTDGIPYETANLANASALLWDSLENINFNTALNSKMDGVSRSGERR